MKILQLPVRVFESPLRPAGIPAHPDARWVPALGGFSLSVFGRDEIPHHLDEVRRWFLAAWGPPTQGSFQYISAEQGVELRLGTRGDGAGSTTVVTYVDRPPPVNRCDVAAFLREWPAGWEDEVQDLLEDAQLAARYFATPLERVLRVPRGTFEQAPEAVMDAVVCLLEGPIRIEAPRTEDADVHRICVVGKARHLGEVLLAFSALHRNMKTVCVAEVTPPPRWLRSALDR